MFGISKSTMHLFAVTVLFASGKDTVSTASSQPPPILELGAIWIVTTTDRSYLRPILTPILLLLLLL